MFKLLVLNPQGVLEIVEVGEGGGYYDPSRIQWDERTQGAIPANTMPPPRPKTRDELKSERAAAVEAITVTTAAGNTFDGDETSQTRMARAIIALQAMQLSYGNPASTPSVTWVLADNSVIQATAAELTEALALAGAAQAAIWVI